MATQTLVTPETSIYILPEFPVQDLLVLVLVCLFVWFWLQRAPHNDEHQPQYPPGPWQIPVVGNLPQLGPNPHLTLTKMVGTYGPVFQIKMGAWQAVVINSIDAAKEAFLGKREDFAARPAFDSFNLLNNRRGISFGRYDNAWKRQKQLAMKVIRKFLHAHSEGSLEQAILDDSASMIKTLLTSGGQGQAVDPKRSVELAACSVMYKLCFGLDNLLANDPAFQRFVGAQDAFNEFQATGGNISDILPWTKVFLGKRIEKFAAITSMLRDLVHSKHVEHKKSYTPESAQSCAMNLIIQAIKDIPSEELEDLELTEEIIAAACEEFMGAGTQTVVSVLQWALVYLLKYPEVYAGVRQEIDDVIGSSQSPSGTHRKHMPYTEAFILETIRKSAALPFLLPHSATRDSLLCGYKVDKDTMVMVNSYALGHDAAIWEKPDEFMPERFLHKNGSLDSARVNDFIPFGAGRRRCIGERFAKLEIFLLLTNLLKHCDLDLPEGETISTQGKFGFSIDPLPFKVLVTPRGEE